MCSSHSQCFPGEISLNGSHHSTCGTEIVCAHVCMCVCMCARTCMYVCMCARTCACVCVRMRVWVCGGEGRRVTASPNKPDGRTRNQQSATVWFSIPMYTYLFHLISYAFPLEGLWCWQMSSFGAFFPPGTEHLLDVRCYARNL